MTHIWRIFFSYTLSSLPPQPPLYASSLLPGDRIGVRLTRVGSVGPVSGASIPGPDSMQESTLPALDSSFGSTLPAVDSSFGSVVPAVGRGLSFSPPNRSIQVFLCFSTNFYENEDISSIT